MTLAYGAILTVAGFVAIVVTIAALNRSDRRSPAPVTRGWWRSWRRTALLGVMAIACGAVGPFSGSLFTGGPPLFVVTYVGLPLLCSMIGVTVRRYRVEVVILWAAWCLGAVTSGATLLSSSLTALAVSIPCLTFGAVIAKLGVRRMWTWREIWTSQERLASE